MGRAKEAADFIKIGSEEAIIEIELADHTRRRNPIITRTIRRDNSSAWTLVGGPSGAKAVQIFARRYKVQIDNLCQFLPQDKVVTFAQMTPIELLESTQNAAGEKDMIKFHNQLKTIRIRHKEILGANKGDREELERLQRKQQTQQAEVERMRERAVAKKKLEWLEKCRPLPEFIETKNTMDSAKQSQKTLEAEVKLLNDESGPVLRKLDTKKRYAEQARRLESQRQNATRGAERACKDLSKEIEEHDTQIKDYHHRHEAERKSHNSKRQEKPAIQRNITLLNNKRAEKPREVDSRAINQEIRDRREEIRDLDNKRDEITTRADDLKAQVRTRGESAEMKRQQIEALNSNTGRQENNLRGMSEDTFQAWNWIQKNQELFEMPVFGPPAVECSLKDPKMAKAVESFLRDGDFKILTVQTEKDFSLLQRKLNREMNLVDIRIRTCSIQNMDSFRRTLPEEQMRAMGLDSSAIDYLDGPIPVLAMLCNERRLHQCAIATSNVSDEQHQRIERTQLQNYYANGQMCRFTRRAEYNESTAIFSNVKPARVWSDQPVDVGRKAALQRELAEMTGEQELARTEYKNCMAELAPIQDEQKRLEAEIKTMNEDKDEAQRALAVWNALPTRISNEEKKLQAIEDWLRGIKERLAEITSAKDEALLKKADSAIRYAQAIRTLKEAMLQEIEAEVISIEATSDFQVLTERNEHIIRALQDKRGEEEKAVEEYQAAHRRAKELHRAIIALKREAEKMAKDGDAAFSDFLVKAGQDRMSMVTLNGEIDSQKAQIEMSEGGNADAIRQFEERAKSIEKLRGKLTNFNKDMEDVQHGTREIRSHWEPQLDDLVAKISVAFSESFERIGCAGQVVVHKASSRDPIDCTEEEGGEDNGLDFANWAIHISVKFRENEPLSLLDSHRQSGGERAVSTIFYLMALQSLSKAPFRVVDEINQGMDPRNERMVHGRMVDVATNEGGSQYFLITPKLLSGLRYKPGMVVHCIVSGENVPGSKIVSGDGVNVETPKMDFRAFAAKAREVGLGSGVSGRRTDSGIGFGRNLDVGSVITGRVAEVGA